MKKETAMNQAAESSLNEDRAGAAITSSCAERVELPKRLQEGV